MSLSGNMLLRLIVAEARQGGFPPHGVSEAELSQERKMNQVPDLLQQDRGA